jgi:phage baseplate assembly protein W|tara:strand:+ start:139 stop:564 length:426 start_codon:yes stop_codon:yes gene_type:complete
MANYDASSKNLSKTGVRVYSDLNLDFTRNAVTNDVTKIKGVDAVKRSVRNLVNTATYERPFHPEMGCGIRELLFENFTPIIGMNIRRKLEEVISNYEPRASIADIAVAERQDQNSLEVQISFYVLNMPQPVTVTTILQRVK